VTRPALPVVAVALAVLLAACGSTSEDSSSSNDKSKQVKEIATNVLTLQSGTVSDLRARRGRGPFLEFDVPPDEMVSIAEKAMKTKVVAVFPNRRAREVVAKERGPEAQWDDRYAPSWLSAAVVIVHPIADDPNRSRVEIHATDRGPFHRGRIAWEKELPPLLAELAAQRAK
jgi:hypothetical protein